MPDVQAVGQQVLANEISADGREAKATICWCGWKKIQFLFCEISLQIPVYFYVVASCAFESDHSSLKYTSSTLPISQRKYFY